MKEYLRTSRSGTYGFLMAIPLMVGYEVLMLLSRQGHIRVGAETWVKSLTSYGHWTFLIMIVALGGWIFYKEREQDLPIKPEYFGYMLGESIIWVPFFFLATAYLANKATPRLAVLGAVGQLNIIGKLGISMGAGVYEEFVFRVVIVGGLAWIGKRLFPKDIEVVYVVAALTGAIIFSAVHYLPPYGDPFTISSFIFRTIAGLLLNALFLTRGFGIAAWTHAFYDMVVLLQQ